jgi:hypothetical protein
MLLSQILDFPNLEAQEKDDPVIPPRHWILFSSPYTTRDVALELFENVKGYNESSLHY